VSTPRRIGTENSKTRALLLDAAEKLMLEEGYPAVTSRHVAAEAGLKPQLVHYYFRTMDDLFLALFQRRVEEGLERLAQALASAQPLWALWDLSRDPRGTALTMEFIALANHRKAVRAEIASAAERFRAEQMEGLEAVLGRYGISADQCPPMVFTVLLSSISRFLVIEQVTLGMSTGHAETVAFVEGYLFRMEGKRQVPPAATSEPTEPTGPSESSELGEY
jgi:AcrR family transcriptional regulator